MEVVKEKSKKNYSASKTLNFFNWKVWFRNFFGFFFHVFHEGLKAQKATKFFDKVQLCSYQILQKRVELE